MHSAISSAKAPAKKPTCSPSANGSCQRMTQAPCFEESISNSAWAAVFSSRTLVNFARRVMPLYFSIDTSRKSASAFERMTVLLFVSPCRSLKRPPFPSSRAAVASVRSALACSSPYLRLLEDERRSSVASRDHARAQVLDSSNDGRVPRLLDTLEPTIRVIRALASSELIAADRDAITRLRIRHLHHRP